MAGYLEAAGNAIRDAWCTMNSISAVQADYARRFGQSIGIDIPNPFLNAYRAICLREPTPPPPLEYPQGRCPGVGYAFYSESFYTTDGGATVRVDVVDGRDTCVTGGAIYGELEGFQFVDLGETWEHRLVGKDNDGNPYYITVGGGRYGLRDPVGFGETQIIRCDGLPDNCGDPVPTPPPPNYWIVPVSFSYEDNSNNIVAFDNGNVDFSIPYFDIDGELNVDARVIVDDPTLNIPVELNFTLNLGDGTVRTNPRADAGKDPRKGGSGGDKNPSKDLPEEVPEDGNPDSDNNRPPGRSRILSGVVVITSGDLDASRTQIFQDENPDIFVPDLGHINFLYSLNGGITAWGEDIKIKNSRHFIPVPYEFGAIDVKGTPSAGLTQDLIKVYDYRNNPVMRPGEEDE